MKDIYKTVRVSYKKERASFDFVTKGRIKSKRLEKLPKKFIVDDEAFLRMVMIKLHDN